MYQIQLQYTASIFNKFDIVINGTSIDNMDKRQTCLINLPQTQSTLQVQQYFICSKTIQIQDGDTIFVKLNPTVCMLWLLFFIFFFINYFSIILIVICLYFTAYDGYQLKVAPTNKQVKLCFQ